ncbi:MAG: class I SAM-dependent methyltransferase [Patescibacteria group bacterium]
MEYLITFLLVALLVGLLTAAYAGLTGGAPTLPTGRSERLRIREIANIGSEDKIFCDLGSGTGRLLFELATLYPHCQFIGVELSLLPYLYSRAYQALAGRQLKNIRLYYGDLFHFNVREADVVFTFQIPGCYHKLRNKFTRELKDDGRLVIEAWSFDDLEPLVRVKDERSLALYVFEGWQFRQQQNTR